MADDSHGEVDHDPTSDPGWGTVRVRGESMWPSLHPGDVLLVRFGAEPCVGDLVVLRLPGRPEPAVKRVSARMADGWWVERDNPSRGVDSWLVGAIAEEDVLAVVRARLWPPLRRRRGGRWRRR